MEFLLVNHPIDCPICDQAGECKLQIYYMDHDRRESAISLDEKVEKGKAIEVGPQVMLDQERCVACSRCVRFCDEITETGELRLFNRGDHTTIGTFPGKPLDNHYSVNTADICPVGALTSRDFRFQARVWYLKKGDSICPGCATGCNTDLYYYDQVELNDYNGSAYRLKPRINDEVNKAWMCDFGRQEYSQVNEGRIEQPIAHGIEVGWDGALGRAQNAFKGVRDAEGKIVGVISPDATNEELWLFRRLLAEAFGQEQVAVIDQRPEGLSDNFLIDADKHPNRAGVREVLGDAAASDVAAYLDGAGAVIVLGADLFNETVSEEVRAAFGSIKHKIVLAANSSETTDAASVVLPTQSYAEKDGTWVNRDGRLQRLVTAVRRRNRAKNDLEAIGMVARQMGLDWPTRRAAEVFGEIAEAIEAFGGLDYGVVGRGGVKLGAGVEAGALEGQS